MTVADYTAIMMEEPNKLDVKLSEANSPYVNMESGEVELPQASTSLASDSVTLPTDSDKTDSLPATLSLALGTCTASINDFDLTAGACSTSSIDQPMYGPMMNPFPLEPFSSSKDVEDPCAEKGVVGLHNLGNTCFMNSGIQSLVSVPRLVSYFYKYFDDSEVPHMSLTWQFSHLLSKMWTGKYSIIYPRDLKNVLGAYHPQFQDYRQHDGQEFLALLLDTMHEQLNESKHPQAIFGKHSHQAIDQSNSDSKQLYSLPDELPSCGQSGLGSPADRSLNQSPLVETQSPGTPASSNSDGANVNAKDAIINSKVQYMSEDSNQSAVSFQSVEALPALAKHTLDATVGQGAELGSDRVNKDRMAGGEESMAVDAESTGTAEDVDGVLLPENANVYDDSKKNLSLEDFYMKDTKTLNHNVLAEEFMQEEVTTDSDKFHKHDNVNRPTDPLETLSDFILNEVKSPTSKPLKDSNLLANVKNKFDPDSFNFPQKNLYSEYSEMKDGERQEEDVECLPSNFCSINNIKRMRVDEDEKNVRMQAHLKVNTNKSVPVDSNIRLLSPNDSQVSRGLSEADSRVRSGSGGSQRSAEAGSSPMEEQMRAECLAEAERAWKKYIGENRSIIMDTFMGQFKSTVVCSECQQKSVTYEPFMYLSVPLPHAMERQICVIFLPSDNKPTVRYLININKQSSVKKMKEQLLQLIAEESVDIILAEVLDNHISRILEDNTYLRYVNDYNRKIYAFEMLPPPLVDELSGNISDETSTVTSDATSHGSTDTLIGATNKLSTASLAASLDTAGTPMDILISPNEPSSVGVHRSASEPVFLANNQKMYSGNSIDQRELDSSQLFNNLGNSHAEPAWGTGFTDSIGDPCPANIENSSGFLKNFTDNMCTNATAELDLNAPKAREEGMWETDECEVLSTGGNYGSSTAGTPQQDPLESAYIGVSMVTDSWKSCAICLEEMADCDLMVHTACGGTLCQSCLEMSYKHYGETSFICPVCSCPVHPVDDFVQLSNAAGYKPKTRILSMPIVCRNQTMGSDGKVKMKLFGHPNITYLPNNTTGENLYETVDRVVPCCVNYSIVLTDGQGLHCSRCLYTAHCSGCEVSRLGEVSLQPGDHLAVCFPDLASDQQELASSFTDHKSMDDLRSKDNLTLFNCFDSFTDSEDLDEHNPWFCPRCKKNQCAKKTITVWRYPETLVVYLKRFVFHELSSSKIDNKVIFPLENLDLSKYISGPITNKMIYYLQSCICHFGGVNAGHYTAYSKHPIANQWHYFNDETTSLQSPQDEDYSNAYILFYQRQGTNIDLNLPEKCVDEDKPEEGAYAASSVHTPGTPQFNSEEVTTQLLNILHNTKGEESEENDISGRNRENESAKLKESLSDVKDHSNQYL